MEISDANIGEGCTPSIAGNSLLVMVSKQTTSIECAYRQFGPYPPVSDTGKFKLKRLLT